MDRCNSDFGWGFRSNENGDIIPLKKEDWDTVFPWLNSKSDEDTNEEGKTNE